MNQSLDGNAIVYCDGAFNTPNGKTAHGLVRFTRRYRILSVVDRLHAGADAGTVLDGKPAGIPIFADLETAANAARKQGSPATHCVVGIAPDGGRLSPLARRDIMAALAMGLHVDSGLHDFLGDDPELRSVAAVRRVKIRDIRRTPPRDQLHFFSGKIAEVGALKVALLGTDSAVGKRTTAWLLVQALQQQGFRAEMIGTGQTAWMQGARYGFVLDSLINDFVSGEIEHAVWQAWRDQHPDVIVLEGQGSLLNPAYPGGFELLAAGRPDVVVLQHAPARRTYDGFPDFPMHPIAHQIQAVQLISGKPVVAITVNHEDLPTETIQQTCDQLASETGLPVSDPLLDGGAALASHIAVAVKNRPQLRGGVA